MAMKRICDICGADAGVGMAYQFTAPEILTDNKGAEPGDSSDTDVCESCATGKKSAIVAELTRKANATKK